MESFCHNQLQQLANGRITIHLLLMKKLLAKGRYITSKTDIEVLYCVPSETDRQLLYEVDEYTFAVSLYSAVACLTPGQHQSICL